MLIAISSPVNYSPKLCFRWANFLQSLKLYYKTISISRCESLEIRLSYRKLSSRKQGNLLCVFYGNSLKCSKDQRGKLDCNWIFLLKILQRESEKYRITRHYTAELQKTKQTLATSKRSIKFTYSDFLCHLKVNGNKLALINHRWKCKKGKGWSLPA